MTLPLVFSDDEQMGDPAPEERYNLGTYIMFGKTKRRTLRVIGGAIVFQAFTTATIR